LADVFSKEKRKEVMSLIRSKNSKAELTVFKHLRKQKIYFQKHYKRAPGTPDIALPRKKKAVFIDGDFWHGRSFEKLIEKRGDGDYWVRKISTNMDRDVRQRQELSKLGWTILSVWESDINRKRTQEDTLKQIRDFLLGGII